MVLITKGNAINRQIKSRSKICKQILAGISCIIIPVVLMLIDPIHKLVNYNLRLKLGSALCSILTNEIKGAQLSVYLFNVSNADQFMYGDDQKLKLNEVGPFVYQEYLWYENLELSEDGTTMAMTPIYRADFMPEKSIAHPKNVTLQLLNMPMLSTTTLVSTYPSFVRFMFNAMTTPMNSKAIVSMNVDKFLWGYKDPIISLYNKLAPGIVYFESLGLLDRLYDNTSEYRVVVGATSKDRFQIKNVTKRFKLESGSIGAVEEKVQTFPPNVYEGVGYPPELTPETPISLYRKGVCKPYELKNTGSRTMDYGGEGLTYTLSENSFTPEMNPVTNKLYPWGLMDLSPCYYGLPFVVSKPHFQDADPKLLEAVDGLSPNSINITTEIVIDRRAGVPYFTKSALQLNLVLDDTTYSREAKKFANTIIPVLRFNVNQPRMSTNIMILFYLVYAVLPSVLIVIEVILIIVGISFLTKALKSLYLIGLARRKQMTFDIARDKKGLAETLSGVPLIKSEDGKMSSLIYNGTTY